MILYFTGTGNSRYLANCLAEQLGDTVTDVAQLIKEGKTPHFASERPYVFVAPVYAWRMPRVLVEWMQRCRFEGNQKAYFVLNCGSEIGAAGNDVQKNASKMGLEYMGTAEVIMPENYLVMFTPPPPEEDAGVISKAAKDALQLAERISSEEPFEKVKINLLGHLYSDLVNPLFYTFYIGAKRFYATDACISCGKCVEHCMLNNITLTHGKPIWGKACTHCMACICKCPTEAIEYGKHTKGRRRYVCPPKEEQH